MRRIRIIGMDSGTRNTVLCYLDYIEEESNGIRTLKPIQSEPQCITFLDGRDTVPSLVFVNEQDEVTHCGYDAEQQGRRKPDRLRERFKLNLVQSGPLQQQAIKYTRKFFEHLFERYSQHTDSIVRGATIDETITYVSYPAKWTSGLDQNGNPTGGREITIKAAADAGFPNVRGRDEPTAAMQRLLTTVSTQINGPRQRMIQKGIIKAGQPLKVLLLDMGAGTTDLVLFQYVPGQETGHQVLLSYPPIDSNLYLGGGEVDVVLNGFFETYLESRMPRNIGKRRFLDDCRAWKERTLSPGLSCQESLDRDEGLPYFLASFEDSFRAMGMDVDLTTGFPTISRGWLEEHLSDHLPAFIALVNGILQKGVELKVLQSGDDIDIVVLTGGHSQWYWVPQLLQGYGLPGSKGALAESSGIHLSKIREEPDRILSDSRPSHTVALGLALQGAAIKITPKASNSVWWTISIGRLTLPQELIIEMGKQELPYQRFQLIERQFEFNRFQRSIWGRVSAVAGSSTANAVALGESSFFVRFQKLNDVSKLICDWINREGFLIWIRDWWNGLNPANGQLLLDIRVSEEQHITVAGVVVVKDKFKKNLEPAFFAINRPDVTQEEQTVLLTELKSRIMARK